MNISCPKCNSSSILNLGEDYEIIEFEFLCLECGFEWNRISEYNSINDFEINWNELIVSGITLKSESEIKYLSEIKKYCNNGGMPRGILAKVFNYKNSLEFEKLLEVLPQEPKLQSDFIEFLFIKSSIREHLKEFHFDEYELQVLIKNTHFKFLKPKKIEKVLTDHLYYFGMYHWFKDNNSYKQAIQITKNFTDYIYQSYSKNVICFTTQLAWGNWFDKHSCSDYSFVFINLRLKEIYLFCFSHSD